MLNRGSGIFLPFNHKMFDAVISDLDRMVRQWTGDYERMLFYTDVDGGILIPRFYPIGEDVVDLSSHGDDIKIESI